MWNCKRDQAIVYVSYEGDYSTIWETWHLQSSRPHCQQCIHAYKMSRPCSGNDSHLSLPLERALLN